MAELTKAEKMAIAKEIICQSPLETVGTEALQLLGDLAVQTNAENVKLSFEFDSKEGKTYKYEMTVTATEI